MFRKLSLLGAILALLVIAIGSYVKLTNAGLGCEDWPACYGKSIVNLAADAESQTANYWIEQGHRYLASGLGILALVLLPFAWRVQQRGRALSLNLLLLILVASQAALGISTINLQLMPIVVTAHLLLGFVTFWTFSWSYLRFSPNLAAQSQRSGLAVFTLFAMLVLVLQVVLGAWVGSNFAGLACTDFPRCNGTWLPEGDYAAALDLFKGLLTGDSSVLPEAARVMIHALHRVAAVVTFIVLSAVMLSATNEEAPKQVRTAGNLLSLLLLIEIGLGIFSVKQSLPLFLTLAHNLFAALLMLPLLAIYLFSKYRQPSVETQLEPSAKPQPVTDKSQRLSGQLKKTRSGLSGLLGNLLSGQKAVTRDLLDEIETSLLMADIGIETTTAIINQLTSSLEREQLRDGEALHQALKENLYQMLQPCSQPLTIPKQDSPYVILVVGVNGAGKTTSIGKLANRLQAQGHSVMLAAGDTFRAAAVEQLQTWGERNNVHVVAQHTGADSASVIFDALESARAKGVDVLIADTAGRLHTKSNLMDELKKIKRIMGKLDQSAPHEVLLVLDAGTGQNALSQARLFNETVQLTGIALTKLDGTAKGGVIFALANQLHIPIRFIGVGEAIEDLQDFDARTFVDALFVKD